MPYLGDTSQYGTWELLETMEEDAIDRDAREHPNYVASNHPMGPCEDYRQECEVGEVI